MGRNTSELRREMDKAFEKLKKYSDRYRPEQAEKRNVGGHSPRHGVFGADKWGRRPGGR